MEGYGPSPWISWLVPRQCDSFSLPKVPLGYFQMVVYDQVMVNWCFGLVVWIPNGSPKIKGIGILRGTPIRIPKHPPGPKRPMNHELIMMLVFYYWRFANPQVILCFTRLKHLLEKNTSSCIDHLYKGA